MSLKTYIDGQVKEFLKKGAIELSFGLQGAPTFKLLPIFKAYNTGSIDAPTSIEIVKISPTLEYNHEVEYYKEIELSRILLPVTIIKYDAPSDQYIIDQSVPLGLTLDTGIYYLEFKNGFNNFETEAFQVIESDYKLTWDLELITWDSELITFNQTKITI